MTSQFVQDVLEEYNAYSEEERQEYLKRLNDRLTKLEGTKPLTPKLSFLIDAINEFLEVIS